MLLEPGAGRRARVPDLQGELGGGRDVQLVARGAQARDHADQPVELGLRVGIDQPGAELRPGGRDQRAAGGAVAAIPELLGDERRERMQQVQELREDEARARPGLRLRSRVAAREEGLGELEIPVAELVPGEGVERVGGIVEAVALDRRPGAFGRLGELAQDPAVDGLAAGRGSKAGSRSQRLSSQKRAAFQSLVPKLR